jgi:xylan 1,4-beta-xylosidase
MRYFIWLIPLFFVTYIMGQTLVLPGDFPDPSVTKIGDRYWATATTSNWAPAFPLLASNDLIHWELEGHVFPQLPEWADYYFWAPEISFDNGKVFVYYSAHKRGGNLCLGVASADKPEGPYTDHGPLMCQEAGSIDGWPMRDKDGKLYLIWKEDGNSVKLPTPIWAMEMNEARTELIGQKKELFRNDQPWESNLVEGVSMLRHGDYIYAFYAGAGCCGRGCSYGVGIARARNLLGPWEKYPHNPITATSEEWDCPGHGTPVVKEGRFYFLYHGYHEKSNVYAGRQGILSEFIFTPDGWIEFVQTDIKKAAVPEKIRDDFDGPELSPKWQWSVFQNIDYSQQGGELALMALPEKPGAFLGFKTYTADYEVEVVLSRNRMTAASGIGLIGDEKNFVVAIVGDSSRVSVQKVEGGQETVLVERRVPNAAKVHLKIRVKNGKDISFYCSTNGRKFTLLNDVPVDGFFLPPWDRAVRVALISRGAPFEKAVFQYFILKNN